MLLAVLLLAELAVLDVLELVEAVLLAFDVRAAASVLSRSEEDEIAEIVKVSPFANLDGGNDENRYRVPENLAIFERQISASGKRTRGARKPAW